MSVLRRMGRLVASLAGTLLAGGLLGYVGMAFVSPLLPGPVQPGNRHEFSYTRDYVVAFVERDAATVNQLELPKNPAERALVHARFEDALSLTPKTLTYLGGAVSQGGLGGFAYVLGVEAADRTIHLVPFSVTTIESKVADLRGGSTGIASEEE